MTPAAAVAELASEIHCASLGRDGMTELTLDMFADRDDLLACAVAATLAAVDLASRLTADPEEARAQLATSCGWPDTLTTERGTQ